MTTNTLSTPTSSSLPSPMFTHPSWMQQLLRHRGAFIGICMLVIIILFAIIGPWISPHTYSQTDLLLRNTPPGALFWFGSDDLGRDIFTRICHGARISLTVGIFSALLDLVVGVIYGAIAALSKETIDTLLMRTCDVLYAIPYLLMVIMVTVIFGNGLFSIIFALTLTGWIGMARIVRGQFLSLKEQEYVLAARVYGASLPRIIIRHLLPNTLGPIMVAMTLSIPNAIFTEAFLSFLGLGVQAPMASWGTMANDGLAAMRYYPWRLFFPSLFISVTMLSFNLIGDGLSDALNPKQHSL